MTFSNMQDISRGGLLRQQITHFSARSGLLGFRQGHATVSDALHKEARGHCSRKNTSQLFLKQWFILDQTKNPETKKRSTEIEH